MLSHDQLHRIGEIFEARARMQPIPVQHDGYQVPARPSEVFELQRKSAEHYYLLPHVPGAPVPPAHGVFFYVILAADPGRIYCGAPQGSLAGADPRYGVQGHTSLSRRADVLYAGEIDFDQGRLVSWSNGSGHYSPPPTLREQNLIPAVARLLPAHRFIDFRTMKEEARRQRLEARGYVGMDG